MRSIRFYLKSLFPAVALAACLASPASAEGLSSRTGTVRIAGIHTHFTSSTKVVNGKTVYVEGTPMGYVHLEDATASWYFHFPYSGDKAKGWLDIITTAAAAGKKVTLYYSSSYLSSGRMMCANYAEEGCIELLGNHKAQLVQFLMIEP